MILIEEGREVGQVCLSCQCKIRSDMLINIPEESRGKKQIVRKSASNREIEVKAVIRKNLVTMSPLNLERPLQIGNVLSRDSKFLTARLLAGSFGLRD